LDGMGGSSCVPRSPIPVSPSAPDDNGGQVDGVPAGSGSADGAVLEPVELDETAQYTIVPTPRPNKEAKLRKEAKELPHLLIHKPFNPYCEVCLQAKLREDPHRGKKGVVPTTADSAKDFGDYVTGDFVVQAEINRGVGGFVDALNLRDLGTGVKMCYPTKDRLTESCVDALKAFGGAGNSHIKRFYSDTEGGFVAACKARHIPHRRAQPGRSCNNSLAERANQDVLRGARACLAQAGLPACFWPYAAPYYCLMENLTYDKDGFRLYDKWAEKEFDAQVIPFGALVEYIPPSTRKDDQPLKWSGSSLPGAFAGMK